MRYFRLVCAALAPSLVYAASSHSLHGPVVVELFTSEGCSSCPSADDLLRQLAAVSERDQGTSIIALEEHVDYWNNLGWKDPFSSPQFRARQSEYAAAFEANDIYTPQMVVNGSAQFVGSDSGQARSQIRIASRQEPSADLELRAEPNHKDSGLIELGVQIRNLRPKTKESDVYLAVTEDSLQSEVRRGENSGRTLLHTGVVRSLGVIGRLDPRAGSEGQFSNTLKIPSQWKRDNLRAVVFIQERATRHITSAAEIRLRESAH